MLADIATVEIEVSPEWLRRPGASELGEVWPLAQQVYTELAGGELLQLAPPRERRRVDVVLTYANGAQRIVEFDERQHFTGARLRTFQFYEGTVVVAFRVPDWRSRCQQLEGREPGAGFAAPRPPLFPGPGGRHRQRAFRDFLADALPPQHGWLPTARFQDVELKRILADERPAESMAALWQLKTGDGVVEGIDQRL